jgi:hypothetical protein
MKNDTLKPTQMMEKLNVASRCEDDIMDDNEDI